MFAESFLTQLVDGQALESMAKSLFLHRKNPTVVVAGLKALRACLQASNKAKDKAPKPKVADAKEAKAAAAVEQSDAAHLAFSRVIYLVFISLVDKYLHDAFVMLPLVQALSAIRIASPEGNLTLFMLWLMCICVCVQRAQR